MEEHDNPEHLHRLGYEREHWIDPIICAKRCREVIVEQLDADSAAQVQSRRRGPSLAHTFRELNEEKAHVRESNDCQDAKVQHNPMGGRSVPVRRGGYFIMKLRHLINGSQ